MNSLAMTVRSTASARRLRVCFVTETYPPEVNGVAMTVSRLVSGLLDGGHQVQLIRPRQGSADQPRCEGDLEILTRPSLLIPLYRELRLGLPSQRVLLRLWRERRPDVVHIDTEGPLGYSALAAARRLKLPVATSFHTHFHRYSRHYGLGILAGPVLAYLRRFHNRADCTLVPTEELAEELKALGFGKLRILARGVDTRLFSPKRRSQALRRSWGAGPGDPVVLYVGRLAAEKNLELAVAAFRAMHREQPRARLVLVGDGPQAARLQSRHPEFMFCGMRTGQDLAAHYASGDVFLFPSLTETFGNVVLEAMASGLAVVAFDYAAAHHHVLHGRSGLRVPVGDHAAFIAAACQVIRNPCRLRKWGQEARQAAGLFAWERIHASLEAIFVELAN